MKKKCMLGLLVLSSMAVAEDRSDRIFEKGKTSGAPMFTQETHIDDRADGTRHWTSAIKDADGKIVMTEVADLKGSQILSQKVEQLQVGEAYELEIVDGKKVKFKSFKIEGDKRSELEPDAVEDLPSNFVTGPVSEPFLRDHKDELLKGKSIYAKFGIFELQRTVNFEFYKKGKDEKKDEKELRIRMEPANFLISAMVDPIDMYFDKETMKLVRYVGRTPIKKKVGDKWKAFDAEILYP